MSPVDPPAGPPGRTPPRRWGVPPAPSPEPEGFPAHALLRAMPDDLGLLLWLTVRDVLLWAGTPEPARSTLFSPAAAERRTELLTAAVPDEVLAEPLRVLQRLLQDGEGAVSEEVAAACGGVASWAAAAGHAEAALAFSDAAARILPRNGAMAAQAGATARRFGQHQDADAWLRRGLGLARRSEDWEAYVRARIELGRLEATYGRRESARRSFGKALRRARRHGIREGRREAVRELLALAIADGDRVAVERYRRAALRSVRRGDPDRARITLQVAGFWVDHDHDERAVPVLQALARSGEPAELRFRAAVLLARAAARRPDREILDEAWHCAAALVADQPETGETARALLSLSRSAAEARERGRAAFAARRALDLAYRLGDATLKEEAVALLGTRRAASPFPVA